MKKIVIFIVAILYSLIGQINAQERLITGKVTDPKGVPIGGVTITAKDYATINTISGVDGEFRIEVFDFTPSLVFSFSGMKNKEVILGDSDRLLVTMEYLPMKNPNPWSFMFTLSSGQSHVYNEAKENAPNWSYSGEPGILFSLEADYFFSQNFGFGAGIGYNAYVGSNFLHDFTNLDNTVSRIDQDGDQFYLYSLETNVNERTNVRTLSLPVKAKFRLRPGEKWSLYANFGVKMMQTLSVKVKAEGNTELQGYYPDYHVVIDDVAAYGFSDYNFDTEKSWADYEKNTFSLLAEIGISKRIRTRFNLDLGFFYEQGLNDLKYTQPLHPADFLNTTDNAGETIIQATGLTLGIRYNLIK